MAKQNQTLVQRIALDGGDEIKRELLALGKAGESAFKALERQAKATKQAATGLNADILKLRSSMVNLGTAVKKVGSNFAFLGGTVGRVGGLIATAFSAQAFIDITTAWTDLNSRIKLATGSTEEAAVVMQRLAAIARRTFSPLQSTAETFADNATILNELGVSTAKQLDLQESLNNALVVSGARGERAAQVQRSFTNAMQLGALRGDDLNNVIKFGGVLVPLLAKELGVGVDQLKKLGEQGRITAEVFQNVLIKNLENLRQKAEDMPATIKDGFVLIQNALLSYIGTADQGAGVSAAIAAGLIAIADNIHIVVPALILLGAAFLAVKAVQFAKDLVGVSKVLLLDVLPAIVKVTLAMARNPFGLAAIAITALILALIEATGGFDKFAENVAKIAKQIGEALKPLADPIIAFIKLVEEATAAVLNLIGLGEGSSGGGTGDSTPAFAGGGQVRGAGTGTSDSILARLSNGEFVLRAKAVRKWGVSALNRLNRGLPALASGGLVSGLPGLASAPGVGAGLSAPGGPSGRPLTLVLDGERFSGLSAPESVAGKLVQFATGRKVRSAGRKPAWQGA